MASLRCFYNLPELHRLFSSSSLSCSLPALFLCSHSWFPTPLILHSAPPLAVSLPAWYSALWSCCKCFSIPKATTVFISAPQSCCWCCLLLVARHCTTLRALRLLALPPDQSARTQREVCFRHCSQSCLLCLLPRPSHCAV